MLIQTLVILLTIEIGLTVESVPLVKGSPRCIGPGEFIMSTFLMKTFNIGVSDHNKTEVDWVTNTDYIADNDDLMCLA